MKKMNMAVLAVILAGISLNAGAKGRSPETSNTSPTVDEQQNRANDPYRNSPPTNTNPAYNNNPSTLPGTPGTESQRGMGNVQGNPGAVRPNQPGSTGLGGAGTGPGTGSGTGAGVGTSGTGTGGAAGGSR